MVNTGKLLPGEQLVKMANTGKQLVEMINNGKLLLREHLVKMAKMVNFYQVSETENIRKNLAIERMIVEGCDILLDVNQIFVRQGTLVQIMAPGGILCTY